MSGRPAHVSWDKPDHQYRNQRNPTQCNDCRRQTAKQRRQQGDGERADELADEERACPNADPTAAVLSTQAPQAPVDQGRDQHAATHLRDKRGSNSPRHTAGLAQADQTYGKQRQHHGHMHMDLLFREFREQYRA
ncbi:hypothetical protein D3C80_1555290 [compost metagenome]